MFTQICEQKLSKELANYSFEPNFRIINLNFCDLTCENRRASNTLKKVSPIYSILVENILSSGFFRALVTKQCENTQQTLNNNNITTHAVQSPPLDCRQKYSNLFLIGIIIMSSEVD